MNAGAGSIGEAACEERAQHIRDAFTAAGVEATIYQTKPKDLVATARRAAESGVDAVVAAGGDGTVSAVAGALVGGEIPLAVLPLGTLNHFARDIGMPDDLGLAAQAIAARQLKRVDVGEVNSRVFINNSSVGLYPETVMSRDADQKRNGHGKWTAMLLAIGRVLRRFPLLAVRIALPDRSVVAATPMVFIGNNPYTINVLSLGKRERLDSGHLSLYMMRCKGRLQMFWLMVRAILQRLEAVRDFEAETATDVIVTLRRRVLNVAVDGEVESMTSPLRYRIRAGALPVLVPPAAAVAGRAA
ncbi:MAG: NAD(+)/NADH kinase [Deltaproteobacteria bacterium]|nr:NAD(+)/NADH kinase [Deltaproteobacteria bacterium]